MPPTDVGSQLRTARYQRGWSVEHAAREAGISPERLTSIEAGDADGSERVAAVYDLHPTLMPGPLAAWWQIAAPVIDRIDVDHLPDALGELLIVLGRAARGETPADRPGVHIDGDALMSAGDALMSSGDAADNDVTKTG